MNTELLACKRLTVGVVYPAYALEHAQVNRIYAEITERYPYQQMQHLPDGGRMSNPGADFLIQTTRMQANESIDYFHSTKDKILDVMSITQAKLQIPQFSNFGIKLTSFMPVDSGNAAVALESTALQSIYSNLDKLGEGRKGTGLRIIIHKEGIYEIKIEPLFSDLSQLYIELDVQYPQPFEKLETMSSKMDTAYEYVYGELRSFLQSL